MTIRSTRRTVLVTGAAVLLGGCGAKGTQSTGSPTPSSPPAGRELAKTSEIPIGGGKIFKEQKVVVTQPTKGEFKAFSAICTHLGCTVGTVANGTINCPCHGSRYRITDAAVVHGPAKRPLPAKTITVKGDMIRLV
ncbi:Rieske (2Fe-2S) protein [Streptomyces colonosanans]|uniref:Cytochrome bc1 complex Rieske iron-sulfur subunit n=1 Tax=Streptomyces colonosanans TaxID=1428652 RepID=A0A1S2PV68_9ACTN|nr:Rieske (2Fe-2S) protein [Streptomyces colonosanans]OIJ97721.1 iron-sulfur protein [Streptomyces colonosanans]